MSVETCWWGFWKLTSSWSLPFLFSLVLLTYSDSQTIGHKQFSGEQAVNANADTISFLVERSSNVVQAFVKKIFLSSVPLLYHLLNVCNSLAASTFLHPGIQTIIVSHNVCWSMNQSHISFLSLFSFGEWLVPNWLMVDSVVVLSTMILICLPWVKVWNMILRQAAQQAFQ